MNVSNRMKKLSIIYLVSLYIIQLIFILIFKLGPISSTVNNALVILFFISIIVSFIIGVICVVFNIKNIKKEDSFLDTSLMMKVGAIPFFIINFMFWALITLALFIVPVLPLFIPVALVGVVYTFSVLIITSSYSITSVIKLYRKKLIPKESLIINIIIQFFFVIDVIGFIIIYFKKRKLLN